VLGCRAHHRGAADVDLLDHGIRGSARGDGLGEGVEVHHEQLEGLDAELGELGLVALEPKVGEQSRVHLRVQGAHAPVEVLGEARQLADLGDRDAGIRDRLRGAAGRDDLDARIRKRAGELDQVRLVGDGDEGAPDQHVIALAVEAGVDAGSAHWYSFRSMAPDAMSCTVWISSSRSTGLMRSWRVASVSPASIGTRRWARIGPVSTPLSTTMTLAPVCVTRAASASRTPCAPGNSGRYAGCVLMIAGAYSATSCAGSSRMRPDSTTRSGCHSRS